MNRCFCIVILALLWGIFPFLTMSASADSTTVTASENANASMEESSAAALAERLKTALATEPTEAPAPLIIAAEQRSGQALLLRPDLDWNSPEALVWSWNPAESKEIAPEHRGWFGHLSDVKPVEGTRRLLTVASGGGVALVDLAQGSLLFYAYAGGNTHSAALLPDGKLVTASSTGNYLRLFTVPEEFTGPDQVQTADYPLTDAHGVVWDAARQMLWALGGEELVGYSYTPSREHPALKQVFRKELPPELTGGHDLYPIPGTRSLFITGTKGLGLFEPKTGTLLLIQAVEHLKSVSLDETGRFLVQQPNESWWSDSLLYLNGSRPTVGTRSGARFYKARWWIPDPFSVDFTPGAL